MNLGATLGSSIGRKIVNGVTGLAFVGFVIGHLIGNLLLLAGPGPFNDYAYFLTHFFHGAGVLIAEAVLLVFLAMHAYTGIMVWSNKAAARKASYRIKGDAGGKSPKGLASQTMLYTGLLLLAFIAFHVAQFKFGVMDGRPPEGQWLTIGGVQVRNVYGLVVDSFAQWYWSVGYMVIMAMLGLHLWHGAWSAFQSLGLANDHYLPVIRSIARSLAVVLTIGFLLLPGAIWLGNDYFQKQDNAYIQLHETKAAEAPASSLSLGE
jgi:succinate dehydrogenase / fumarate reductase cytochrome b subunit